MIITFDVDGVIAGGTYIPEWDRNPATYATLPLLEPSIPKYLLKLSRAGHVLYAVTSRNFPGALQTTRQWLKTKHILHYFAGVLCVADALTKVLIANAIGADLHIDDDSRVLSKIVRPGFLFLGAPEANWYPWSKELRHMPNAVFSWAYLYLRLSMYDKTK